MLDIDSEEDEAWCRVSESAFGRWEKCDSKTMTISNVLSRPAVSLPLWCGIWAQAEERAKRLNSSAVVISGMSKPPPAIPSFTLMWHLSVLRDWPDGYQHVSANVLNED